MKSKEFEFLLLTVYGLVQGVGFRPYTACLCEKLEIDGFVRNTGGSVEILFRGTGEAAEALIKKLSLLDGENEELPGAFAASVETKKISGEEFYKLYRGNTGFYIEKSDENGRLSIIPPDIGICKRCERELVDDKDRRYRHPFISCVSCGPRFSIMKKLPYDRENTSMDRFSLCGRCMSEYKESPFRRYAQTIACRDCGPVLKAYVLREGRTICAAEGEEALKLASECIRSGGIAAAKNVGGYHFVFDACLDEPALRLRSYKKRENKPFAVMFKDTESIKPYCRMGKKEKELLVSGIRPIVLLKKTNKGLVNNPALSEYVSKKSNRVGAMLPADAIQILLLQGSSNPLVMTSANEHSEPITADDDRALEFLEKGAVDIVLTNDREIVYPCDDPVFQVVGTKDGDIVQVLRRARGMVPKPVAVNRKFESAVFACGGDLKAVFGFAKGSEVILSGHYGDIEDVRAFGLWKKGRKHFEKMFDFKPEKFAADMHPSYITVKEMRDSGRNICQVQHHYAHIMSVAAEHRLEGRILGVALDGTGYGTDGKIWGSELLICDTKKPGCFFRAGHFEEIKLTGGDEALQNADITAMCFAHEAEKRGYIKPEENPFNGNPEYELISRALENDINTYFSTSAGRFFDAVSAVLDICHENTYEGECPVLLQQKAEETEEENLPDQAEDIIRKSDEGCFIVRTVKLFSEIIKLKNSGYPSGKTALYFHTALKNVLTIMLKLVREDTGINTAALSGGVFANGLLLKILIDGLKDEGFEVYINEEVPPNDGGLALGQIYGYSCEADG